MYEHYRFEVDPGQAPLRIDKFLMGRMPDVSRNRIQNASKEGLILVNGNAVKPNHKVKPNDVVSVNLDYPKKEIELIPEYIPLDIKYEDDEILVLNKPSNLVVHPGVGNRSGTLVNGLLYHYKEFSDFSEPSRSGLVHRLDKDTSGLMVVAKTEGALKKLSDQFYNKTVSRKYKALVWGEMKEKEGVIRGHIARSPKNRKLYTVYPEGDQGKEAITTYKVLEELRYVSLLECKLETGRTHQIRVHFKYIKHPVFGDRSYGGDKILKGTTHKKYKQFIDNCFKILKRQALHATTLGFSHPSTGEWMEFEENLPQDLKKVMEKWRNYISDQSKSLDI
ncbi:MAG: RluA family pseudouridine synthase [Flavobacteriales bacterium]